MPPLKTQPNAEMVAFEHIDALNKCDWNRLMAQYPEEVLFILPNAPGSRGAAISATCSPLLQGTQGCGLKAPPHRREVKTVGDTVSSSWRVEALWLAEPYKGGDAYETERRLMYAQVTTFNPADMKFKK